MIANPADHLVVTKEWVLKSSGADGSDVKLPVGTEITVLESDVESGLTWFAVDSMAETFQYRTLDMIGHTSK